MGLISTTHFPVPVRVTACGLSLALSVIVTLPVRAPFPVGLKVTRIVQALPAFKDPLQLFVCEKSPLAAMLVRLSVAFPVLESVRLFARLDVPILNVEKLRFVGERLTTGAVDVDVPVPDRVSICGLPLALSVIVIAPFLAPVAVGVNVTLIVQAAFCASEFGHVVAAKSPLATTLVMPREALPVLVRVTLCDVLDVPTVWLLKARLVGEMLATGAAATPDPMRLIVCEPPGALSEMATVPLSVL